MHETRDSKFIGEPNPTGFKAALINRATSKTSLAKDASNRYLMEDVRKRNSTQVNGDLRHQLINAKAKLNANYDYMKGKVNNRFNSPASRYGARSTDIYKGPLSKSVLPKTALSGGPVVEMVPSDRHSGSRPETVTSTKLPGFVKEDG